MANDRIDDIIKSEVLRGVVLRTIIAVSLSIFIIKGITRPIDLPSFSLFSFYGKNTLIWSLLVEGMIGLGSAMVIYKYINLFSYYDSLRLIIVYDIAVTLSLSVIVFILKDLTVYITFMFGVSILFTNIISIYINKRNVFIANLFKDDPNKHSEFTAKMFVYFDVGYLIGLVITLITQVVFNMSALEVLSFVVILKVVIIGVNIYSLCLISDYLTDRRQPTITKTILHIIVAIVILMHIDNI
jgi:hypothetical protein